MSGGTRLGPYEVVSFVGAGGMGEVYHARDVRLGRSVALKVLAAHLAENRDLLGRFEQEARAVAALSHPNILALHDVGRAGDTTYAVMELLEGATLRERLRSGRLGLREAARLAAQTAEGLHAAHEKGIVHRDVKPENLFVTRHGAIKILDFGLAKVAPVAPEDSSGARTRDGIILGTMGYMSPEQVRGGTVDARSDVFALGAVLYEMLAGRKAFPGDLPVQAIAAVLTEDPAPLPGVPPALDRIVRTCLEKRPDQRFASAHDLALALRTVLETDSALASSAEGRVFRPSRRMLAAAAGVAATLALLAAAMSMRSGSDPRAAFGRILPATSLAGAELHPALAPDGESLAFAWNGANGENADIYVKSVTAEATRRLTTDPARDCCPTWSADGRLIAFLRVAGNEATIFTVPAAGGGERRLRTIRTWFGSSLSLSPDGAHLVYTDGPSDGPFGISRLALETLESRPLSAPSSRYIGDAFPTFSPDGSQVAFARLSSSGGLLLSGELSAIPAEGGDARVVHREPSVLGGLDWTADGRELIFSASRTGAVRLWRVPADASAPARPLDADDTPLASGLGAEAVAAISDAFRVSAARRAPRIAYTRSSYDTDIWRVDTFPGADRKARRLIATTRLEEAPQLSPDGRRIAFSSTRSSAEPEIWVCASDGAECAPVTSFGRACGTPRWSPDGTRLVFDSVRDGQSEIYSIDLATRTPRRLTNAPSGESVPSWSRDGRSLYFASDRGGSWQVWTMPAAGGAARVVTRHGGFAAFESADGRWVYYTRTWSPGVWRTPVGGGDEQRVTDVPRCWGYWALAKGGLYAVDSRAARRPRILFHDFATGRATTIGALEGETACGESGLAVSSDGAWLAYVSTARGGDVMVVDGFRQDRDR